MKHLAIVLTLLLAGCLPKGVNVSEACGVLKATLYQDGRFSFTPPEIDALRPVNQVKIVAIKNWYKDHCLARNSASLP